ncbi:MAG: aminotransferase class V-fold PLP-dependent enzyme, partial [Gemmatimonadaceae bacterium]
MARLINAKVEEVALMVNTTYGINLAARALGLRAGDVVVAPAREFPANVYPWMALEKDGVTFEMIPALGDLVDEAALLRALDRPNVRVLAVSWVSFATGYRVDLATLGRACRERGIYFVVDAIQGLGPLTLDVRDVPIDILACGAQKWLLSPWGTGFVYVRDELVRALEPHDVGWMAMKASEDFTKLLDYDFTYFDDARRFEVVTLPFQDIAGFVASLELLHELGPRDIESHVTRLVTMAVEWALSRSDVCLVTPREHAKRGGIVS